MNQKLYFATWKGMFSSNKTWTLTSAHKNVEHLKIWTNASVLGMTEQLLHMQMWCKGCGNIIQLFRNRIWKAFYFGTQELIYFPFFKIWRGKTIMRTTEHLLLYLNMAMTTKLRCVNSSLNKAIPLGICKWHH